MIQTPLLRLHVNFAKEGTTVKEQITGDTAAYQGDADEMAAENGTFGKFGNFPNPVLTVSNDHLKFTGNTTNQNPGTGNFTLCFHFKSTDARNTTDSAGIFMKYGSGSSLLFPYYANDKKIVMYCRSSIGVVAAPTCTTACTGNIWRHYALVRNGTAFTVYVNGVQEGTVTAATFSNLALYDATKHLWICSQLGSYGAQGQLEELRWYFTALGAHDIKRIAMGLHPLKGN
jgi:hypothetical protein